MFDADSAPETPPGPSLWEVPSWIPGFLDETFKTANQLVSEYRPIARLPSFPDVYLCSSPAAAKHVLQDNNKNYTKARSYELLKALIGEGLLTSEGDLWLRQRRIVAPMFHRHRVDEMVDAMRRCTRETLRTLEDHPTDEPIEIVEVMSKLTLSIIGNLLFNRDIGGESDWIREGLDLVLNDINRRFTAPLALPRSVPTAHNRRVQSVLDRLDQLVEDLIAERRGREEEYDDLLSMLMLAEYEETGERMSAAQIHDEVLTFIVAGHETTANALAWALYLLAEHPEVRRRLEEEADAVLSGETPTLEEMGELDYTEQVLDEVLRMYPPAWSVGRTPKEDDEILGYHVSAGSIVTVGPYFVHHNPEVWEDPETFDPSRFGPDGETPDHRFAHFPFGGGPRKCVGADLAIQESKLVLATLARNFRLDLVDGHPVEPEATVTITPGHGLKMMVESR